jgi:hypothetical protein
MVVGLSDEIEDHVMLDRVSALRIRRRGEDNEGERREGNHRRTAESVVEVDSFKSEHNAISKRMRCD